MQPYHRRPDHDPAASAMPTEPPPLDLHERARIAHLLGVIEDALNNDRATSAKRVQYLAGYLRKIIGDLATWTLMGEHVPQIDQLTADLEAFVATLGSA